VSWTNNRQTAARQWQLRASSLHAIAERARTIRQSSDLGQLDRVLDAFLVLRKHHDIARAVVAGVPRRALLVV
jgi:hypothetical protein